MVVFIHVLFYGKIGVVFDTLARFAVPLFFIVSGFYSYGITPEKVKKRMKHILGLFIFAITFFILFRMSLLIIQDNFEIFFDEIIYCFKPKLLALFVFFNLISYTKAEYLWYLLASLYVYVIFYFSLKLKISEKIIFGASFLLLLIHLLLGEGLSIVGISLPIVSIRNFLFMGLPFFGIGMFARKNKDKLRNIPNYIIAISLLMGSVLSLFSCYMFGENELYTGTLFIIFSAVVIFIKYSDVKYPKILESFSDCSTYIYIFHLPIAITLKYLCEVLDIDIQSSAILTNLLPVTVCILSTVAAYIMVHTLHKILFLKPKKSLLVK